MVQVVRWYLSAYHAGRKSAVAKKPYNPILGEVFQCYWDIPTEKVDSQCADDGPIPWCRRDQLTFIAEQVSHHPPSKFSYSPAIIHIFFNFNFCPISFRFLCRTLQQTD